MPFGYRVHERKLIVHDAEAQTLKRIFEIYLEVGTVRLLIERLRDSGIKRPGSTGDVPSASAFFGRGALQTILANPIYVGQVRHGKLHYDGQHKAIIDQDLWDAVKKRLKDNHQAPRWRQRVTEPSPLMGKLYDGEGRQLVPSHTIKYGRRYRFYISESLRRGPDPTGSRLPARVIEAKVVEYARTHLRDAAAISNAATQSNLNGEFYAA